MAYDPKANEMKEQVAKIYKELTEAIKQTILIGREYESRRLNFSMVRQLFEELQDVAATTKGGYQLLEDLAYTKSGEKAILNLLYYDFLKDLSIVYRKIVCKIATREIVKMLKDIVPEPYKK